MEVGVKINVSLSERHVPAHEHLRLGLGIELASYFLITLTLTLTLTRDAHERVRGAHIVKH